MSVVSLVFLLTLYASNTFVDGSSLPVADANVKYAGQALTALQRLLDFFESDANDLNLDGVYGLRLAEGQLLALQSNLSNQEHPVFTDKTHLIRSLSSQIDRIANQSLVKIAETSSDYLQRFTLLASRPFLIDYEVRSLNPQLIEHQSKNGEFDEETSDGCFGELLGSNEREKSKSCLVSQSCWQLMTSTGSKGYRITHQLLWFLVSKNIGCLDHRPVSAVANRKFRFVEDRFCANIYEDAKSNYQTDYNQDLFLEQILLCSIVGYKEFLRLDWFQTILTWQDEKYGCFIGASDNFELPSVPPKAKRHLLFEQEMTNGCLSHKSGLAAGVLAAYARAFLT